MARITVEDCIQRVPNRFELVMLAAQRARDISAGAPLTVSRDNDKNAVVALREIAEGTVDLDHLRYELIYGLRRHTPLPAQGEEEPHDPEKEISELIPIHLDGDEEGSAQPLPEGQSYAEFDVPDQD